MRTKGDPLLSAVLSRRGQLIHVGFKLYFSILFRERITQIVAEVSYNLGIRHASAVAKQIFVNFIKT